MDLVFGQELASVGILSQSPKWEIRTHNCNMPSISHSVFWHFAHKIIAKYCSPAFWAGASRVNECRLESCCRSRGEGAGQQESALLLGCEFF